MIKLSIVIATFNSEKYLEKVLSAIRGQDFLKNEMEIILVDGGSEDKTRDIGKRFDCRWIINPFTEPIYAKYLGFTNANGKYLVYLDHDEILKNPLSFKKRIKIIEESQEIKAVLVSGYINSETSSVINKYINEFGDPFSFFIYRLSKNSKYFIPTLMKRYKKNKERTEEIIFDLRNEKKLPLIELCASGCMIDRNYYQDNFSDQLNDSKNIPHLFYMLKEGDRFLAVSKNDEIEHSSVENLKKYFKKIKWRIKNNIFFKNEMGTSGFSGRKQFSSFWEKNKSYLFIPYALLIIPVLIDSIYLSVSRKNLSYLIHTILSLFTALLIINYFIMKTLGYKPSLKSYDEEKIITRINT